MKVLLLILPVILASCITSATPKGKALPVLGSPARAAVWGAPEMTRTPGGYELIYQNPNNPRENISIKGSRKLLYGLSYPPDIKGLKTVNGKIVKTGTPQLWEKVQIAGQETYFYQSHEPMNGRSARFKTLGQELTAPNGVIGYYAVEGEGSNNQVRRWISELRFQR